MGFKYEYAVLKQVYRMAILELREKEFFDEIEEQGYYCHRFNPRYWGGMCSSLLPGGSQGRGYRSR
jgi:hypothetical protein